MLPDKTDFNRKIVGRTGIVFAIFQFVVMIVDVVTFFLFHISYPVFHMLLLEVSFVTPESLLATAAFESFGIPVISGLLISTLVLFLLTIGLTIGVYRKKVVCALLLLLEVASYTIVPVWGLASGRFIFIESKHLIPIYAVYFGILPIMVLFIGYGIWGRSARTARLVKRAASVIRFLLVSIPINFVIGCRALLGSIKTDFKNFNWKVVGRAGIGFAIFQFLGMTVGAFFLVYMFIGPITPEYLLAAAASLLGIPGNVALLISDLVLLLLTIGLTIGVYRKKVVCAILLLVGVASYIIVAVCVLASGIIGKPELGFIPIYTVYFGILAIIVLFVGYGIWGRSARAAKLVKRAAFVIVSLLVIIPIVFVVGSRAQLGSISGHIYRTDGTIITTEVSVFCAPLDPNVHITHGDPAPPALVVNGYGVYKIDDLPASRYIIVAVATNHSLFSEKPITVNVKKRLNTPQDLILVPGGSITGRVSGIEPAMNKSAPFKVQCIIEREEMWWSYFSKSCAVAEDGTYLLEDVAPGTLRMYVNNGWGPGSYHAESAVVTVKSGEQTQKDFSIIIK
jgi:hypothetical protein